MFSGLKKREPTTLDEYIDELCLKNGCTREDIEKALDIEPCNCSYAGCTGWIAYGKYRKDKHD